MGHHSYLLSFILIRILGYSDENHRVLKLISTMESKFSVPQFEENQTQLSRGKPADWGTNSINFYFVENVLSSICTGYSVCIITMLKSVRTFSIPT